MKPWIVDADDIDVSGELSNGLIKHTPSIDLFLDRDSNRFVVTGTKGYGKTLLLKAKRLTFGAETVCIPVNSLLDKPIGDKIFSRSAIALFTASTEHWRRVWRVSICVAVLKRLDMLDGLDGSRALMKLVAAPHLSSVVDHFVNILEFSKSEVIDAASDTDQQLVPRLRGIGRPVAAFVDSVDEYFNKHIKGPHLVAREAGELSADVWYYSQMALVEAMYELRRVTHHLKVFAAVRKEAFVRLLEHNPMGQQYSGSAVDLTYSKADLRDIFCDNVRAEAKNQLVSPADLKRDPVVAFFGRADLVNSYTGEAEDPFDYVYRHTLQRPRDLMTIGAALSALPMAHRADEEATKRAVNDAATEIGHEYIAEIETYLVNVELSVLWSLFPSPVMNREQLDRVAAGYDAHRAEFHTEGPNGLQVLTLLYKSGLLGYTVEDIASGTLMQRFTAPGERSFDPDASFPRSSNYFLHPVLTEVVREHNRGYAANIDRVNIIGDERPWRQPSPTTETRDCFVLKADVKGFSQFMEDPDSDAKLRKKLVGAVETHGAGALVAEVIQGDSITLVHDDGESLITSARRIMEDLYRVEGRPTLRVAIVHGPVRLEKADDALIIRGGEAMRMVARVEPLVTPNEIWADETVSRRLDEALAFYAGEPIVPPAELAADGDVAAFDVRKRGGNEEPLVTRLYRIRQR